MTARGASLLVAALAGAALAVGCGGAAPAATGPPSATPQAHAAGSAPARVSGVQRLEYVFPDGAMYVYDLRHLGRLVERVSLPGVTGIRGVAASPATHRLYISFGEDQGPGSHGSLLCVDLSSQRVLWRRTYARGVDSLAIGRTGRRIYLPDGELSSDSAWSVIDAGNGNVLGRINGGLGPHNTIVGPSGKWVYLGGRNGRYLSVASTRTGRVVRRVGPLLSGVRPFTVNGAETTAYTTATGFLGFQVSSLRSGRVLYTENFGPRFTFDPSSFVPTAPSHGISLSPNSRRLWVIDAPNNYVHVFDVSGVPARSPRRVADLQLRHTLSGSEAGCAYDCLRDGWLQHSLDGCLVLVGDSGDVFSTTSRRIVGFLPALRQTRKFIEIDWRGGHPVATSTRSSFGRPGRAKTCAG